MAPALGLCALLAAGCGGSSQDAGTPSGTFPVEVVSAAFPRSQHIAQEATMALTVRNAGRRTVPNVAVTIVNPQTGVSAAAFAETTEQPDVQSSSRPIWIVDTGPSGGDTAYSNTWALGPLPRGAQRTFRWRVLPTKPGTFRVHYEVAASLTGKAKAKTPGGGVPQGTLTVHVSGRPARAIVTDSGKVVRIGGGGGG